MTYSFDPELAPFAAPPLDYSDPPAARAALRAVMARQPAYSPSSPVAVEDRTAGSVPVRLYRPAVPGPLPALLFPHWGGFVTGDLDTPTTAATRIADQVGALVVCPDYRLAPEYPYPAGLLDCYATLEWLCASAASLGVDPERIGVGGLSAGGGLAAGVALLARDWRGPRVCFQYLLFPQLDDRLDTVSAQSFVDTPMLDRANLVLSWDHYLNGARGAVYAAPARAPDLSGLPPTFVGVCEYDPLRDEGITFAHRLIQAGVKTEVVHYVGTFHASIGVPSAVSRRMVADQVTALRRGLHGY
jgi:acetyl esterase